MNTATPSLLVLASIPQELDSIRVGDGPFNRAYYYTRVHIPTWSRPEHRCISFLNSGPEPLLFFGTSDAT